MENDIKKIIISLLDKGLNTQEVYSLLLSNNELLLLSSEEIDEKISLIYNGNIIYCVLFCNGFDLKWSILDSYKGGFTPFKTKEEDNNLVVNMLLDYIKGNKIKDYIDVNENDTYESMIKKIKHYKFNSKGYELR